MLLSSSFLSSSLQTNSAENVADDQTVWVSKAVPGWTYWTTALTVPHHSLCRSIMIKHHILMLLLAVWSPSAVLSMFCLHTAKFILSGKDIRFKGNSAESRGTTCVLSSTVTDDVQTSTGPHLHCLLLSKHFWSEAWFFWLPVPGLWTVLKCQFQTATFTSGRPSLA